MCSLQAHSGISMEGNHARGCEVAYTANGILCRIDANLTAARSQCVCRSAHCEHATLTTADDRSGASLLERRRWSKIELWKRRLVVADFVPMSPSHNDGQRAVIRKV